MPPPLSLTPSHLWQGPVPPRGARDVPEAALVSCQLPPARPAGSALGIGREGESEWPHASSFSSDRNCQGSSRPWGCQGPCSALSVSICRMGGSPRRPLISTQWLWPVCLCRHVDLLGALPESHTGPGLLQKGQGREGPLHTIWRVAAGDFETEVGSQNQPALPGARASPPPAAVPSVAVRMCQRAHPPPAARCKVFLTVGRGQTVGQPPVSVTTARPRGTEERLA